MSESVGVPMVAGADLDAEIARSVMGWRDVEAEHNSGNSQWFVPSGIDPSRHRREMIPRYSADMSAAWEVVEKMREMVPCYFEMMEAGSITSAPYTVERDTRWAARFVNHTGATYTIAETPALSICLASLDALSKANAKPDTNSVENPKNIISGAQ